MDLVGSTEAGLEIPTSRLDRFNKALVEQIKPHLEKLELTGVLLKFTGDGWLLMSDDPEKVPALCCLATIMANRFQREMSDNTGIPVDKIPPLRVAICSGRDISVQLPDGRRDWVGDSARRATRASGYCFRNEILINETVREWVFRDFDIKRVDVEQRTEEYQPKRMEERFPLYVLGQLKPEAASESEAAGYFVYTLDIIGRRAEAATVAQREEEHLTDEVKKVLAAEKERFQRILRRWNRLVASLPDYSSALEMLKNGQALGLSPDVFTYNTLISKTDNYDEAKAWVEAMRAEDIQPNVVTYNTLISKTDNYDEAKAWVETMRAEDIQPDVFTYNTLISKTDNYDEAKAWVEAMRAEGIQPNVVTYNTLISKAETYDEAKAWVETMRADGIQPDVVTYNTLISRAKTYDEANAWVETMQAEGIQPDVVTYNTLISKAETYDEAKAWVETMRAEGIQPDVVTYSALIRKAESYDEAKAWVEAMRAEGIHPNVVTYNTLISKAETYDEAKAWVETMWAEGIQPNVVTYQNVFGKDLSCQSADDILKWYLSQEYHPEEPIQTAIAGYRRKQLIDQALRLSLDYPHLQAARRVVREHGEEALSYFGSISERDPQHPNADFASGVALIELGRQRDAEPHLRKALELATDAARKMVIEEWFRQIDRRLSQDDQ